MNKVKYCPKCEKKIANLMKSKGCYYLRNLCKGCKEKVNDIKEE